MSDHAGGRGRLTRRSTYAGLLAGAVVLFTANSTSHISHLSHAVAQTARAGQHHWHQIGRASWYGKFLDGHPTASGEDYDIHRLTCAHRTLPLGSLVRVTNLRNHKSIVVRVNDRGPVPQDRIVDLSYAAARFLGFTGRGTAPVRLELIRQTEQLAQLDPPRAAPRLK